MRNPNTSVATAFACLLWTASFVLAGVYAVFGTRGLGVFAILCMGAGATLSVHQFHVRTVEELIERERSAFRFGQQVQQMRPVE